MRLYIAIVVFLVPFLSAQEDGSPEIVVDAQITTRLRSKNAVLHSEVQKLDALKQRYRELQSAMKAPGAEKEAVRQPVVEQQPQQQTPVALSQVPVALGDLYSKQEKYQRALEAYTGHLQKNYRPSALLLYKIARTHEKLAHWDQAREWYQKIIQDYPETPLEQQAQWALQHLEWQRVLVGKFADDGIEWPEKSLPSEEEPPVVQEKTPLDTPQQPDKIATTEAEDTPIVIEKVLPTPAKEASVKRQPRHKSFPHMGSWYSHLYHQLQKFSQWQKRDIPLSEAISAIYLSRIKNYRDRMENYPKEIASVVRELRIEKNDWQFTLPVNKKISQLANRIARLDEAQDQGQSQKRTLQEILWLLKSIHKEYAKKLRRKTTQEGTNVR